MIPSSSLRQRDLAARNRALRAARAAGALAWLTALATLLPAADAAALDLPVSTPEASLPTVTVPSVPSVPSVPAVPGVPGVPSVPGSGDGLPTVEVPSLQTLEALLGQSQPAPGRSSGTSTGSHAGGGAGAGGSGSVLAASPAQVRSFQVLSVNVTKTGRILETIALPAAGSVVVRASERRAGKRSRAHGASAKRGPAVKVVQVAKLATRISGGVAVLVLNPKLAKSKSKLVVATTYTPSGGVAATITRSVVVTKRASSSRRKHH